MNLSLLAEKINVELGSRIADSVIALDELTLEVSAEHLIEVGFLLRDAPDFDFNMLIDLAGVDYSNYGISEWLTEKSTERGFERAVNENGYRILPWVKPRFAAVYHLLSLTHNHRIRVRCFAPDDNNPQLHSVVDIWPAANWYEREAFDLFGIVFHDHPDLRRLLTDYGFVGHPFRKDFPISGNVEVRYDANAERVIYQPVSIPPRTLVPKTIRTWVSDKVSGDK